MANDRKAHCASVASGVAASVGQICRRHTPVTCVISARRPARRSSAIKVASRRNLSRQ